MIVEAIYVCFALLIFICVVGLLATFFTIIIPFVFLIITISLIIITIRKYILGIKEDMIYFKFYLKEDKKGDVL